MHRDEEDTNRDHMLDTHVFIYTNTRTHKHTKNKRKKTDNHTQIQMYSNLDPPNSQYFPEYPNGQ